MRRRSTRETRSITGGARNEIERPSVSLGTRSPPPAPPLTRLLSVCLDTVLTLLAGGRGHGVWSAWGGGEFTFAAATERESKGRYRDCRWVVEVPLVEYADWLVL